MRVTNKMIMNNASSNINSAKECVNTRNKQMTSQKKIDRPSDDPVIAVRSLRLSTTLSQVTQYHQKNIPDATSWIEVTETSLINIRALFDDCKGLANKGTNDTYNKEDRNTMITQMEALQKQLFEEGNADYANRTVFTGYRTNSTLTFTEDAKETTYSISQRLSIEKDMEEHRYYDGVQAIPTTEEGILAPTKTPGTADYREVDYIEQTTYYRLRLNYDKVDFDAINDNLKIIGSDYQEIGYEAVVFDNESVWSDYSADKEKGTKTVPDDKIYIIKETGDIILGKNVAANLKEKQAVIDINYKKTGFNQGEIRPEFYYNCTKTADPKEKVPVTYTKYTFDGTTNNYVMNRNFFDIEYTVAANQTMNINTEACDAFTNDIQRDLTELIDAVKKQIAAHDKYDQLKKMKGETQYQSEAVQEQLGIWMDALKKESDYFDDNIQKLFSTEIGKIDKYYATISLSITDLGCKKDSLDLTGNRVGDQRETVQSLQSQNDDLDLSQIIIDYTAAYTAYQASLTAAGKLGDSTLLNYL
ncbi:flagellar hook-associated protein 3 FlgL [Pseudobutyrivibrio sp. ACV-2]|uniref:flagellin N-terminal helical domain-containing protein n=1 Tax=Pseudobutyrivibrio sp. ACV-2 TaxID=1520801 RepID=UPI000898366F|nr:hypothetical protein [Pseudobutyrivibrio sp. ACV-2]SEA50238.1 flagellar hook-associated protein 3 FlgL [Pseudobutyrivibrio sp. ACV-2]